MLLLPYILYIHTNQSGWKFHPPHLHTAHYHTYLQYHGAVRSMMILTT